MYNAETSWVRHWKGRELEYPAEYLVRILKGTHPHQSFRSINFLNKKICDIGCGSGSNIVFLKRCGFDVYGTEIAPEIVAQVKKNLASVKTEADIRVGSNDCLPFKDNFFDFTVSWNACYYMGNAERKFETYIKEFARVLKTGGYGVFSIPKKTSFVFQNSKTVVSGYQLVINDPSAVRNGGVLRMFDDEKEIKKNFGKYFKNFSFGSQEDDCFGYNYHWHLMVCQKK